MEPPSVATMSGQRAGKTRMSPALTTNLWTPPVRAFRFPKELGQKMKKESIETTMQIYASQGNNWFNDFESSASLISCASQRIEFRVKLISVQLKQYI